MSFGADTDYWALVTGDTKSNWQLQSSSTNPTKTEAQAQDSFGTIAASTVHDTFSERECVYMPCSDTAIVLYDTANGIDFRLGKVINGAVITGIDAGTSNTDRLTLTIRGQTTSAADTAVSKFQPELAGLTGQRKAQSVGVTEDTATNVTGSSANNSVSVQKTLDSQGNEACLDVYGGRMEGSTELVGVTGNPGAAADTGFTIISGPSIEGANTEYETGTVNVFKNLTRD